MSYPPPSPSPPPSPAAFSGGGSGHGRGCPSPPPSPPPPPVAPLVAQPVHQLEDDGPLLQNRQSIGMTMSERFGSINSQERTAVHDAPPGEIDQDTTAGDDVAYQEPQIIPGNIAAAAPRLQTPIHYGHHLPFGHPTPPIHARATPMMRSFSDNQGGVRASPEPPIRRFFSSDDGSGTAWREVQDAEVEIVDATTEFEEVLSPHTQSDSNHDMELELTMQGSQTPLEQQETEAETSNAITWSVLLPFLTIVTIIGVMIGYETTIYGGSTDSDMFIDKFFPKEHFKQIGFETVFVCDYYSWKIQVLNCTFHFAALISILVVEIALALRGKCSYLIFMCFGCFFHALGGFICALAENYMILWMGRGLKGVGMGLLFESVPIIMNMIGSEYEKVVDNWHKFGLVFGPVVATFLNMMMGLKDNGTPWKLAFWFPSVLSAATLLPVVFLMKKPELEKEWQYRWMTCRRRSRPLVFIEVVRTLATPIQDLNLYSHIIVMLFTPSSELTSSAPFAICACQFIGLVANGWYVKVTRTKLISSSLIMTVIQVVTFLTIFIRNNVTSPFSTGMGVTLLVGQAFFMLGNSVISSPAGWVTFPLEDEVKAIERWMPIISMAVQGGIALLSPFIMCELGMKVYATWAGISALLSCFLYLLLPETRDATSKEIQRERFRSHWFWQYLV